MKYPYCDSENVENGRLIGGGAGPFKFILESKKFFRDRSSTVSANVCLECGKLFDFEVDNLSKLNRE